MSELIFLREFIDHTQCTIGETAEVVEEAMIPVGDTSIASPIVSSAKWSPEKSLYITGPFLQGNIKNRNQRIYPT